MSQDSPDDPLAPRDVTILRPRPGAARKPTAQPAPPPPQAPPAPAAPPQPQFAAPPPHAPPAAPLPEMSLAEMPGARIHPLVHAATPLLLLAGRLRGQITPADVEGLRRQLMQEVGAFEERARRLEIPPEDVLAARYALCTVVDESVLSTPWGVQSGWASHSLLVTFHREASGGEKFFQILDRVSGEPQRYLALLELLYACLALGFEGKYRLDPQGAARLVEIRQNLYRRIESLHDSIEPELSPRWKGVEDRRNAVMRFVPLWVVAAACAAILLGTYIYFDSKLGAQAEPVNAALAGVGLESLSAPVNANVAVAPSGLRELLAPEIERGLLAIEEAGARTVITFTVPDLFASASTRLEPRYEGLVHEVGAALEKVPGRIVIVGHTDNQPLRSFKIKDNYELSRLRAQEVAELIERDVTDASRIETAGKGALEPRYEPADLPENRARNRRVEIIHRRDT